MTDNKTLNETLRRLLATNIVCFTYKKVNGEIRHAKGTRNLTLARAHTGESIPTPTGYEQPNSYYDVESLGWRSYRPENLISIDKINGRETFADGTPVEDFPPKYTRDGVRVPSPVSEEPKHYPDDPIDLGFLGDGIPKELIHKSWEELGKDIEIVPLKGKTATDEFARLVARYVVDEIVERLAR